MLPSKLVLSKLLGTLYDAAADPLQWPRFLCEVTRAFHGNNAALVIHDVKHLTSAASLHWGIDQSVIRRYDEYYGQRDIWRQKALSHSYPGWIATSEEVCSMAELQRSEFYNDLLGPNDMAHAMWSLVEQSDSRYTNFGVYRGLGKGEFKEHEVQLLRFLAPHMKRAFAIHFQFADLKHRGESLQAALDALSAGVILVGHKMRIVAMNRNATKLVAESDGLLAIQEVLRADSAGETSLLERLVAEAEATSNGRGLGPAGAMLVSRKSRSSLQLLVTPVRNLKFDVASNVKAIVFVNDPDQRVRPSQSALEALFGLTPAEYRVAVLLGDGHAPPVIAEILVVSRNTLKSQLSSIYRKTGTSSQSQLVRILSKLAINAEHKGPAQV
jgi:DNA-binding CsgD family transcriptional regulator/PAS domain-containing protein